MTTAKDVKAVIFKVGHEEYGLPIHQVISSERMQPITAVPQMPPHMMGISEIRRTLSYKQDQSE